MFYPMKKLFLSCLLLVLPLLAAAVEPQTATVRHIIDGDTFVTAQGRHVRLLGINTPEKASKRRPAEAFADEATDALRALVDGKEVRLVTDSAPTDRYNRLLAHVYLPDGTWVNRELVAAGLAHVYTFADNRAHVADLIAAEDAARAEGKGIWSHRRWRIRHSDETFEKRDIGRFFIVQGRVLATATVRGTVYLNFGPDWRTDFTVELPPEAVALFRSEGIDPLSYKGQTVEVRGVVKPVNGFLVTVSHPEQLRVLDAPPVTRQ
jgi:endonuclease YncB( thermonuclease family)